MRRPLVLTLLALTLFGGALGVGFVVASRLGPEQVRAAAERSLARALGGEVHVTAARLAVGQGLSFEVEGLRAWPEEDGPALQVERAAASVDPASLLLGRLRLRRIVLDEATLRVVRGSDGALAPAAAVTAVMGERSVEIAGGDGGLWSFLERTGAAARAILRSPLPVLRASLAPLQIELRRARFTIADDQVEPGARWELALEEFEGFLVQDARGREARIGGSGRLVDDEGECGWITLEGRRERDGHVELSLDARHLDLRVLAPYATALHPELTVTGLARGGVTLLLGEPEARRVRFDLLVSQLDARVPRSDGLAPIPVQGDSAVAAAELELSARRVRLLEASLDLDGERVTLDGVVERPLRRESLARMTVRLRNLDLQRARSLSHWLPDDMAASMTGSLDRVEAGRVTRLEVEGVGEVQEWASLANPDASGLPVKLRGDAFFSQVTLRTGDEDRIEGMSGRVQIDRDRVRVLNLRRARDVPELDIEVIGLERLLERAGSEPPPPAQPLPGLAPLVEFITTPRPPEPERPNALGTVEVHADWFVHPATGFPFEDLEVKIGPRQDGIRRVAGDGWWGGLAMRGEGHWRLRTDDDPGLIRVRIVVSDEQRPEQPPAARSGWARGHWRARDAMWKGVGLPDVRGGFYGEGHFLRVVDAQSPLGEGGHVLGSGSLDLSKDDHVPLRARGTVRDGQLGEVGLVAGLDRNDLVARFDAAVEMHGPLVPRVRTVTTLTGHYSVNAGRGELRTRPPMASSMARTDASMSGLDSDEPLRFETLRADITLEEGWVRSDALLIENPGLRIVASGGVQVNRTPQTLEGVIGFFPDSRVDTFVGLVPLLGPILQGPDEKLVAAYLEVTGTWEEPQSRRIGGPSFVSDPKIIVPKFVRKGLSAIQAALTRMGPGPSRDAEGS